MPVQDAVIVGDGPVGQILAIMLAEKGWQVTIVDRWSEPYTMSRAVAFDSEAARILSSIGLTSYIEKETEPSGRYSWQNGAGQTLLDIHGSPHGWCDWPDSTSIFQPGLEEALTARGTELPTLRVLRGHEVVDVTDHGSQVDAGCAGPDGERTVVSGRWLVGCDGANSFVRGQIGTGLHDLDFSRDWLICDVVVHDGRAFDPNNLQICDPARPRTSASAGPGHRRWEFMRLENETVADLCTEESAWRLLELFGVTPLNATLLRYAVYRFESKWAECWRSGRMFIAGDAAHVMPPFAGQGMCSGIRDAANLSWKLDLVLRGLADDAVLDTYSAERVKHVQHAIRLSVDLGRVICQLDPVAAADRDLAMKAARERGVGTGTPQAPVHALSRGLLYGGGGPGHGRLTGKLTPQARVRRGSRTGLFDDVVGTGFLLLASEDPRPFLSEPAIAFLKNLEVRVVQVVKDSSAEGDDVIADVEGVYLPYLADGGARAVLVRPDFYVFGQIAAGEDYESVIGDLSQRLGPLLSHLGSHCPAED